MPTEESAHKAAIPGAPSRETVGVQVTTSERSGPMGLLESLKVMVTESLGSQGARRGSLIRCEDQPNEASY